MWQTSPVAHSSSCYSGSLWPLLWVIRPAAEAGTLKVELLVVGGLQDGGGLQCHASSVNGV